MSTATNCTACDFRRDLNTQEKKCVCKQEFNFREQCVDIANGNIIDKVTGRLRSCINGCSTCTYDKDNGPEICLDNIINTRLEKREIKKKCHEDYDKEFCQKQDVKIATFIHNLDNLGGLKIKYNELTNIPDIIIEYIQRQPNPHFYLKSLFEVSTD